MNHTGQCIQTLRVSVFLCEAVLTTPALAIASNLGGPLSLPKVANFCKKPGLAFPAVLWHASLSLGGSAYVCTNQIRKEEKGCAKFSTVLLWRASVSLSL